MKLTAERKAVVMGTIAGMRGAAAVAVASRCLGMRRFRRGRWALLAAPSASSFFTAMAAAELIADKLIKSDRTAPAPLTARVASGALSGAALCASDGVSAGRGAALGALSAVASAFGFHHARQRLASGASIPQQVVGLAEDALMVKLGRHVLRR